MKTRDLRKLYRGMVLFAAVMAVILAFSKNVNAQAASYAKKITLKLTDGQDATAEIQKALDEAEKAGTKKKQALVSIPAGTYYISKTLNIGSNTCLSLDKKTVIKKNPNPKDPILYMLRSKSGTKGGYSDTSKITIKGGTWDAEYIKYNETSGGSLFFFAHTNNLNITDVTLCHNFGTHLIEMGGVKKCTIKNCTLYGFKAASEDTDKEAIQLDICHSDSILPAGGPFDDTPCTDITVTGCEIYDYPRAIGTHMMVDKIYHNKISISKNNFHDISAAVVYGYNYLNVTVKNNTMTNVGSGVQIKSDSDVKKTKLSRNEGVSAMSVPNDKFNIKITGNTITLLKKEDQGGGYGVFIYGSTENPMKAVTISQNEFLCNAAGIYLRYVDAATIDNNRIDRHVGAISVEDTKFTEDAIKLLTCNGAVIDTNMISTVHEEMYENGIAMREECKNAILLNNTINGTTRSGIALFNDSSVIKAENIVINNAGMYGINIDDSEFILSGGSIKQASGHGIMVDSGATLTISDFEISGCGKRGINVKDNCTLNAVRVTVSDNSDRGIDIGEGVVATIDNCTVSGNKANAINIDGSDSKVTVTGCDIINNDGEGLHLKNGIVNIFGNTVKNNCLNETDGKAVAVFSGITGSITGNILSNPNAKSEIKIFDGAKLDPAISTAKTEKVKGTTDAGGNRFE